MTVFDLYLSGVNAFKFAFFFDITLHGLTQ